MKHTALASLLLVPAYVFSMPMPEMVQETIKTHPQIHVVKEDLYVQRKGLTQVKAGNLPTLDVSYSVGPETTRTPANNRQKADLVRQEATATITQNVFNGFGTVEAIKEQKALILSADKTVQETANTVAAEAVSAYLEVLRTHTLYQISKENVEVHEKYLNQIKKKVDAGVDPQSDYRQTLTRLENALSDQYLYKQNYENAVHSFERILPSETAGSVNSTGIEISGSDLQVPTIGNLPAEDMNRTIAMAIENNPTIHVSEADIKASYAAVRRSNAAFRPKADIKAQAYWSDEVHGIGYNTGIANRAQSEDEGYNALLVFSFNVFNGMADSAIKQANQHRYLKQRSTLADAKRFIGAHTKIAWTTYDLTGTQLEHLTKSVQASKQTVSDYQKEHKLGRRSIVDLLNIELEYNQARNRQVTAQYDQLLAYYQILANTGKLLEEMSITVK